MEEGWYLMTVAELERALHHPESGDQGVRLSIEDALAYRNAGNFPDDYGRTLRLVLSYSDAEPEALARRRALFEPDYHTEPRWRRPGSKAVNVVPMRRRASSEPPAEWWSDPRVDELEREWQRRGTMRGVPIPQEYRSFVHKTVLALEATGEEVSARSIADSIARWLPADDAERVRRALDDVAE